MGIIIDGIKDIKNGLVKMVKGLFEIFKIVLKELVAIIGKFWGVLINWFHNAVNWVEEQFHKIVTGAETFIKKVGAEYQEISYHYSQNANGEWERDTVVKQKFVSEDEIPDDIKALAAKMEENDMINMTNATYQQTKIAEQKLSA